jgi:hypothetical protein
MKWDRKPTIAESLAVTAALLFRRATAVRLEMFSCCAKPRVSKSGTARGRVTDFGKGLK